MKTALTAFFSKVFEKYIVEWLLKFIGSKIDPKQFGGVKGSSISHYLIEVLNFITLNLDYNLPIAVLGCAIDFSKAFNRQNHNILVTKLSDMGVPGWLINLVMGFLSNRSMVLNYKGSSSSEKPLPGGGAQGTLLGLLLFLVLINDCGFQSQSPEIGKIIIQPRRKFTASTLHAKFIDDLTILEALKLDDALIQNTNRTLPDQYHARTGHKLNPEVSQVLKQIKTIQEYALKNEMKINFKKSQFIMFNPSKTYDFLPEY